MPKVELGTFRVVAGEELKIEIKNLAVGGAFCVFGVLWISYRSICKTKDRKPQIEFC
jgi:hypothetical protein